MDIVRGAPGCSPARTTSEASPGVGTLFCAAAVSCSAETAAGPDVRISRAAVSAVRRSACRGRGFRCRRHRCFLSALAPAGGALLCLPARFLPGRGSGLDSLPLSSGLTGSLHLHSIGQFLSSQPGHCPGRAGLFPGPHRIGGQPQRGSHLLRRGGVLLRRSHCRTGCPDVPRGGERRSGAPPAGLGHQIPPARTFPLCPGPCGRYFAPPPGPTSAGTGCWAWRSVPLRCPPPPRSSSLDRPVLPSGPGHCPGCAGLFPGPHCIGRPAPAREPPSAPRRVSCSAEAAAVPDVRMSRAAVSAVRRSACRAGASDTTGSEVSSLPRPCGRCFAPPPGPTSAGTGCWAWRSVPLRCPRRRALPPLDRPVPPQRARALSGVRRAVPRPHCIGGQPRWGNHLLRRGGVLLRRSRCRVGCPDVPRSGKRHLLLRPPGGYMPLPVPGAAVGSTVLRRRGGLHSGGSEDIGGPLHSFSGGLLQSAVRLPGGMLLLRRLLQKPDFLRRAHALQPPGLERRGRPLPVPG